MARVEMGKTSIGVGQYVWGIKGSANWPAGIPAGMCTNKYTSGVASSQLSPNASDYADGVLKETEIMLIIDELVEDRKVVQRKIDAARKRLKRTTNKLNVTESEWLSL